MDIVAQETNLTTQEAVDVLGIGDDALVLCTRYPWGSHSRCCVAFQAEPTGCRSEHRISEPVRAQDLRVLRLQKSEPSEFRTSNFQNSGF